MDIQVKNKVTTENNETAVNTVVSVNTDSTSVAPIDRSNEKLIDNSTTFNGLLRVLAADPEVRANAMAEAENRAAEEKEAKLREELGDDFDLVFDQKKANNNKPRRPGAIQLRTTVPRVAFIKIGDDGLCEVFSNGYAVYDNGNRKVVIWVPDCGAVTYYFNPLNAKEQTYMPQSNEIDAGTMGELPWYNAVMIAGENRIEFNMDHPKSKGTASDSDVNEEDVERAGGWYGSCHFDTPEEAYLKKEAEEERRNALTDKQRKVYVLYFEYGYTTREIAERLGVQHPAIVKMIARIKERAEK